MDRQGTGQEGTIWLFTLYIFMSETEENIPTNLMNFPETSVVNMSLMPETIVSPTSPMMCHPAGMIRGIGLDVHIVQTNKED